MPDGHCADTTLPPHTTAWAGIVARRNPCEGESSLTPYTYSIRVLVDEAATSVGVRLRPYVTAVAELILVSKVEVNGGGRICSRGLHVRSRCP